MIGSSDPCWLAATGVTWHAENMLDSVDHVTVAVRDLESATRDYTRLLGRRPAWRGEHPPAGSTNTLFNLDNIHLELIAPEGMGSVGDMLRVRLERHGPGPVGVAFATRDISACQTMLKDKGLEPEPIEKGLARDSDSGAYREWLRLALPTEHTAGVLLFAIQHTSPSDILPPSDPIYEERATVSGLDHAVLKTAEPDRAKRLYGDQLGFRLALDRTFEQWGMRLLFFRVGGTTVEIAAPLEPEERPTGDRFWGLSWRVHDIEAIRSRLTETGIALSEIRPGRKPGTRVCTVQSGAAGVPTLLLQAAPTG